MFSFALSTAARAVARPALVSPQSAISTFAKRAYAAGPSTEGSRVIAVEPVVRSFQICLEEATSDICSLSPFSPV